MTTIAQSEFMNHADKLVAQIMRHEGSKIRRGRHYAYEDTEGYLTIGYGRNLAVKGLAEPEARMLLGSDMQDAVRHLVTSEPWTGDLDDIRIAVLVNMTFNMGIGKFLKFKKLIAACKKGDWALAAKEMLDSKWAGQVGDRAIELAKQMETGEWQDV